MAYDLAVFCFHQLGTISVQPEMSMEQIMELVGSYFDISLDSFELQVYDEQSQRHIDFDDEYVEELRKTSRQTYKRTIKAEVLFAEVRKTENFSCITDTPSPSYVPANSPSSMSALEDFRSTISNIDRDLCLYDNSPASPRLAHLHTDDDSDVTSHVLFVRDVAPYQRSQYQLNDRYQDASNGFCKKRRHTIRIQGVKTDLDKKHASILPEIKIPSLFLQEHRFTLVVAIVIEERNKEQVTWHLDTSKGFLRDDAETDTDHVNPLFMNIDRSNLTNDGVCKLSLRMCTIAPNQVVKTRSIFYTLPLNAAQNLHSADYISNTARLACVIADQNSTIQWKTFGLSDFLRSKSYAKRKVEDLNSVTTNGNERTAGQPEEIPHTTTFVSRTGTDITTTNLPRKHVCLRKEFTIVLFGLNLNEMHDVISEINQTGDSVIKFDEQNSLLEFLTHAQDHQVVLILSNSIEKALIPLIHDMPQVHSIYVFYTHNNKNEEWTKNWRKIIGGIDNINAIWRDLKQVTRENLSNFITINMASVSLNTDLNANSQSFKYRQYMKDIACQIQYNEKIKQDFVHRSFTVNDPISLVLDELNHDYDCSSYVWWYIRESFFYSRVNEALRQNDGNAFIKIRYAMRDMHSRYNRVRLLPVNNGNCMTNMHIIKTTDGLLDRSATKAKRHQIITNKLAAPTGSIYDYYQQIQRLHKKKNKEIKMTLYRGQGLTSSNFEKLIQNRGGFLSFNSFLSTSISRDVSYAFAESAQSNPDLIGTLFRISMNTSVSPDSFVSMDRNNCLFLEDEILFPVHSVFRIKEIKCVNDRLWQVNLTLSDAYNKKLEYPLEQCRQKVLNESANLSFGRLLMDMGEFEKAEQYFREVVEQEVQNDWEELAYLYNQLGYIKNIQNNFNDALRNYQKALKIRNDNLSYDHLELARLLTNIGIVLKPLRHYSRSITYFRRALDIQQKSSTLAYADIVIIYNKIGQLYSSKREYKTSLSYFQKAIEIQQNFHVPSYPFLAITYVNISELYHSMGDKSTALNFLQKALVIYQHKCTFISPELIEIHNMIDTLNKSMGNYMPVFTNLQNSLPIQPVYNLFRESNTVNNEKLSSKPATSNTKLKTPIICKERPKSDSEHFVGTMNEVEWMDSYTNAYRIAYENLEHMKQWLLKVPFEKLMEELNTGYINQLKFSREKSKQEIKDYLKLVRQSQQLSGLVHAYTSGRTGFCTKLNYDLSEIGSKFHFLSTQNLFNSDYLDDEVPKGLGQSIFAAILINHSFFQPYHFTGTVYRGMNITSKDLEKYETREFIMTRSFLSTSIDETMAKRFMSGSGDEKHPVMCIYKVVNPRSSLCIKDLSLLPEEEEVLIHPFTVFRIVKEHKIGWCRDKKSDPVKIIHFEECNLDWT